jgi:hypothetical protein
MVMTRQVILILMLAFPAQAIADHHFQIAKVYAGQFGTMKQLSDAMQQGTRNQTPVPDYHIVDCNKGQRFGVGYVIVFESSAPANFEIEWEYAHLAGIERKTQKIEEKTARKQPRSIYNFEASWWVLEKKQMIDGDFVVTLRRDEKIFLQHVFHVRGCESELAGKS